MTGKAHNDNLSDDRDANRCCNVPEIAVRAREMIGSRRRCF